MVIHFSSVISSIEKRPPSRPTEGYPGAGLESSFAGSVMNVQFMIRDSKSRLRPGGWGYGQLRERQTRQPSAARKVLPLPPRLQKIGITFCALRACALSRTSADTALCAATVGSLRSTTRWRERPILVCANTIRTPRPGGRIQSNEALDLTIRCGDA
jgi:hypothetical protein